MKPYSKELLLKDFLSSIVVFLVALPLCMGIAMASGVSPIVGLLSGIIGGLVVGAFTGSPLQVSGPAAGLVVVVYDIIQTYGLGGLALITAMAGIFQIVFFVLKTGPFFRAISPSVVKGMLTGIGVLIFSSQFHVMLDDSPKSGAWSNIISIPEAIVKIFDPSQSQVHMNAGIIGMATILLIIGWNFLSKKVKNPFPGPLVAIVLVSLIVVITGIDLKLVNVPTDLWQSLEAGFVWKHWTLFEPAMILSALMLAFIATTETLLSVNAVDQIKVGHRSNYNQELFAQGLGNTLAGIFGALPITGVIVRSSANVEAGGETRASTFMHGIWLLAVLSLFPVILSYIPTSALAAILVFTGYKLIDVKIIKTFNGYGKSETLIYLVTVAGVVFINLLAGVAIGFGLSILRLLWKTHRGHIEKFEEDNNVRLIFHGQFSFLNVPKVDALLMGNVHFNQLTVDLTNAHYTDHAIDELLKNVKKVCEQNQVKMKIINDDHLNSSTFKTLAG